MISDIFQIELNLIIVIRYYLLWKSPVESQLGVFEYCVSFSPCRVAEFLNRVLACLTTFGHLDLLCGLYQHSKATAKFPSAICINGSFVGDKIVDFGCLTTDIALKQNSHSALKDCLESKFLRPVWIYND